MIQELQDHYEVQKSTVKISNLRPLYRQFILWVMHYVLTNVASRIHDNAGCADWFSAFLRKVPPPPPPPLSLSLSLSVPQMMLKET